jgi:hypothetical protein
MARRLLPAAALALLCAATASSTALGDGGPSPGVVQGWNGVVRGDVRYVAVPTATGETVVEAVSRRDGRVMRFMTISGSYGIPQVAFDGSTAGLSRDGRTLVLGEAAFGGGLRRHSSFAVVNLRKYTLRTSIKLRGDFSFDALSPGARMLYLIQHVAAQDYTKYQVRAYDLGARRLLQDAVVDKRSWEGVMQGAPFARVSGDGGRWVYTLYAGAAHPFVHALDTTHANAVCIDLPKSWSKLDVGGLRLHVKRGATLVLRHRSGGKPLAVIDLKALRVRSVVRTW